MSERDLHRAVTDMASAYGLLWWHDNDSRRNKSGLPDLLIVGRKAVWVELKAEKGRFRPAQQIWLAAPSDLLGGKVQALMEEIR